MSLRIWEIPSCARIRYLEILLGIVFTKFMVYFDEEISDFQLCCEFFLPTEIGNYFWEFLNWKTRSFSHQSLEGRRWRCRPGEWEVEIQSERFERSSRVLGNLEVSSDKDWGVIVKNNLVSINQRKKVISINQLKLQGAWAISCYRGVDRLRCYFWQTHNRKTFT
jgi:hypothetical protein